MRKIITALLLIGLAALPTSTAYGLSIGVKQGDWIAYNVSVTGDMPGHDAQWARMDVVSVQGSVINTNMTTQFTNGTYLYENITLNLETGQLGDDFFIPAHLSPGDTFYDAHAGNIAISSSEQRTYAGAQRTVLLGHTDVTSFVWDKQTGILVEAYSNYSSINFTMKTVTSKTNIWQPQTSALDATTLAYFLIAVVVTVIVIDALLVWRRKRRAKQ